MMNIGIIIVGYAYLVDVLLMYGTPYKLWI